MADDVKINLENEMKKRPTRNYLVVLVNDEKVTWNELRASLTTCFLLFVVVFDNNKNDNNKLAHDVTK